MRVLRWPGYLFRGLLFLLLTLVCLIVYLFGRLGTLFIRDRARRQAAVARLRGRILRRVMTTLGATFIKMGQVMSSQPDLFASEIIDELKVLQDRLPAFGFRRVRKIVEQDLGAPIDDIFAEFDERPVAAASVAQVHRANLTDGTEVAVKVLRPNVRRQVERDGAILLFGARVLAIHPTLRLSNPVGHLRHFVQAIIDQTDLALEADNNRRFHENFKSVDGVVFPRLHDEYCTRRVITMEFMRGEKIDQLGDGDHSKLALKCRTTIFKMCFDDGFLHADLHPGNLMVRDNGDLVIFDLGLAKLLHEDVLIQFIDMTKCLSMGRADDLVRHLKRFHQYLDDVDWDALRKDVDEFGERFRAQNIRELEYSTLLNEMLAIGRRYRVRPVTDMTLVFVAMVTAQGIGKMLDPDVNVFDELARFLMPILMRRGEFIPDTDEARVAKAQTA